MVEYVAIIDKKGNIVGKATYQEMILKNLLHTGIHIYVFNSKGEILITKRTEKKKTYPGLLEISIGGALSYGESHEQSAYRELVEELGVKNVQLKYLFDFWYEDEQTKCKSKIFSCVYDGKITLQREEVEDYFWISIPKLKEMIERESKKFTPQTIKFFEEFLRRGKI